MISRALAPRLADVATRFPVVALTGPRQSGKTTLAKATFPRHDYCSLEDPSEREEARSDPKGFLRRFRGGVILDEVQRAPDLLSVIQGIVDADDVPGRFVLTGSQQFHLMSKVTQTLAGRVALLTLLPFSVAELARRTVCDPWRLDETPPPVGPAPPLNLEETLFAGLYPRIHDKGIPPGEWLASYYRTYVERDVREVSNIGDLDAFQRFVRLCAGRSGQLLNLSSLGADAGVSHVTARKWLSVLEAGYIVHLLPPHHANFSKRLVKTPKLHFLDTGLLCHLLRIRSAEEIRVHSMRGAIFETFVVSELVKAFANVGEAPPLFFWRDRTGHEVDVVIDAGTRLIPIEVKAGETVSDDLFAGLRWFSALGAPAGKTGLLVYAGETTRDRGDVRVVPWFAVAG